MAKKEATTRSCEEILEDVKEQSKIMIGDGTLFVTKGTMTCAKRARMAGMELGRLAKEFRKASLEEVAAKKAEK